MYDIGYINSDNDLNLDNMSNTEKEIIKKMSGFKTMTKKELKEQLDLRIKDNVDYKGIVDMTKNDLIVELERIDGDNNVVLDSVEAETVDNGTGGNASAVTSEPIFELEEKHKKIIDKFISKSEKYITELCETKNTSIEIETELLDVFLDTPILKK